MLEETLEPSKLAPGLLIAEPDDSLVCDGECEVGAGRPAGKLAEQSGNKGVEPFPPGFRPCPDDDGCQDLFLGRQQFFHPLVKAPLCPGKGRGHPETVSPSLSGKMAAPWR